MTNFISRSGSDRKNCSAHKNLGSRAGTAPIQIVNKDHQFISHSAEIMNNRYHVSLNDGQVPRLR